jgi:hypothetical protein
MPIKLTQEQFVFRAKGIHGDKYDYSRVVYAGDKTKVIIICSIHGPFEQRPNNHIHLKQGCCLCAQIVKSTNKKVGIDKFVERAIKIHGLKYDYSLVEYIDGDTPVNIICKKHGVFQQAPSNHTHSEQGCPRCNFDATSIRKRLTQQQFVDKSNLVHGNKYNYDLAQYTTWREFVNIGCVQHGNFSQAAYSHLQGIGCPSCARTSYSKKAIQWLNDTSASAGIFIQHAQNGGEYIIPNTRLKADGYCAVTNTIYEFHGSAWHGDPSLYSPTDMCHPYDKEISAGELYERTLTRERRIRELGYTLIVRWESEVTTTLEYL